MERIALDGTSFGFYVTEQISPRIAKTPDGFLVCSDVPIARTGTLVYNTKNAFDLALMPWLKDVEADERGLITVLREPDEVFSPQTIESFEGKPVILDHPLEFLLDPLIWKDFAKGNLQNVRRGQDDQDDLLLADLLIADEEAINEVETKRRRAVSCGYRGRYMVLGPGLLKLVNIIGNHVAIVRNGRAGDRCVIMDSQKEETPMKTLKEAVAAFKGFWKDASEEEKEEVKKDLEDCVAKDEDGTEERLSKIETTLEQLVESDKEVHAMMDEFRKRFGDSTEEDPEKRRRKETETNEDEESEHRNAGDTLFKDAASRAEVLLPGHKMPVFDASQSKADSLKTLDAAKREVLIGAYKTDEGRKAIEIFTRGPVKDFATLDVATLDAVLVGASELVGRSNNSTVVRSSIAAGLKTVSNRIGEVNKANREFWSRKQ
jgi:hypothetical protein